MKKISLHLLANTDVRIHHRCARTTPVWAAIQGPFKQKKDLDTVMSYMLGASFVMAIVAVFFDVTIWRPL
jgi:hypothetical protein